MEPNEPTTPIETTKPTVNVTETTSDVDKFDKKYVKQVALLVLLSFVFGIAGSIFGASFLAKKGISFSPLIGGDVKTVQVSEDSAVVDVVKKASPAVVSIIISKD